MRSAQILVEGALLLNTDAAIEEAPPVLTAQASVECGKQTSAYPIPESTRSGFNVTIVSQESWSPDVSV